MRHDCLGEDQGNLAVKIVFGRDRLSALLRLLEKIRDGDEDWSISIGAQPERINSSSHLQKWLTSISHDFSLEQLLKLAQSAQNMVAKDEGAENSRKRLEKRSLPPPSFEEVTSEAPVSVGLVQIDDKPKHPRFVTKLSIENGYLGKFLFGLDIDLVRGVLPPVTVRALVSKSDSDKPTRVSTVELVHQAPSIPGQTDFLIYTTLRNMSAFVKAGHKLVGVQHGMERLAEELVDYRAFIVQIKGRRVLDSLIRIFEMQWSLTHKTGLFFCHGPRRQINLAILNPPGAVKPTRVSDVDVGETLSGEQATEDYTSISSAANIPLPPLSASDESESDSPTPVKHTFDLAISTNVNSIKAIGKVTFPKQPAYSRPYLNIYWESIDLSVFPVKDQTLNHVELLHMSVQQGHAKMLLAMVSPLQMLFQGHFSYVFSITKHSDATIRGQPSLVAAWRHLLHLYENPLTFPRIKVSGKIGQRQVDVGMCLPPRATFMEDKQDWPTWVTDVIKTRVKIAGFHEAALQILLELPRLGNCSAERKTKYKSAVGLRVTLPSVTANGCLYPKDPKTRKFIAP